MKKISCNSIMEISELEKLSNSQLISMLINKDKELVNKDKEISKINIRPIPKLRKSVKKLVENYEDNILLPHKEFRDQLRKPIPTPRTLIIEKNRALKKYTKSYGISITNILNPLVQLHSTRKAIEQLFKNIIDNEKGIKFVETLKIELKKRLSDKIIYKQVYFSSGTKQLLMMLKSQKNYKILPNIFYIEFLNGFLKDLVGLFIKF